MLRASLALVATAAVAFALGWTARPRTVAAAAAIEPAPRPGPTSCLDEEAMRANQNLVDQLQESKREKLVAEAHAHLAELKSNAAERERTKPAPVRNQRDEWARMAKDNKVRLRTPCASWNMSGAFRMVRPNGSRVQVRRGSDAHHRAVGAGLEEEDRELLAKAYENAHARTWSAIAAACEQGPFFKQAVEESSPESDADRVAICQASLLPNDATVRSAMRRVAEARAAGSTAVGSDPHERVAFALSESVDVLYDEMKKVLGEEKAARAMDFGVLCTNEAAYDLTDDDDG